MERRHAMPDADVLVADAAPARELEFLERQVDEYNAAITRFRDGRLLVILLRDSDGHPYAGLGGHTWGGTCEVKFLWVHERRRRSGIGSRLLRAAEDEARSRGCALVNTPPIGRWER